MPKKGKKKKLSSFTSWQGQFLVDLPIAQLVALRSDLDRNHLARLVHICCQTKGLTALRSWIGLNSLIGLGSCGVGHDHKTWSLAGFPGKEVNFRAAVTDELQEEGYFISLSLWRP